MLNALKERIALIFIILFFIPFGLIGIAFMLIYVLWFGKNWNLRGCFRTLDHLLNVTIFGGSAWESLSSHAWRERENKFWAPLIIFLADTFHQGHCRKANIREQPIVDLVKANYLEEQTIKF